MTFLSLQNYFINKSKSLSRKGLYNFLGNQYDLLSDESKILLVGSGGRIASQLHKYALKKSFSVLSVDIDVSRNPDIVGDICSYDFNDDKYDVIIMAEVLEHFHNPQKAVENIYRVLNKGGRVIITVPFIFPMHDRPHDYFRFTRYGLELLFKDFDSISIKDRNNWGEAISILMVRHAIEKNWGKYIMTIMAYSFYPLFSLLGNAFKTDSFTTGYIAVAFKK